MDQLTVFFESLFWVGIFEREDGVRIQTCRLVFGAEPKDVEIYVFVLREYARLTWSRPEPIEKRKSIQRNPKRVQRDVQKAMKRTGVSTKAQEVMRLEREANKLERKKRKRSNSEKQKQVLFKLRQEKKKQKRKGH